MAFFSKTNVVNQFLSQNAAFWVEIDKFCSTQILLQNYNIDPWKNGKSSFITSVRDAFLQTAITHFFHQVQQDRQVSICTPCQDLINGVGKRKGKAENSIQCHDNYN
jgi:hypothetical protein